MSREREDAFIAKCKEDGIPMAWESELILRYGYGIGFAEGSQIAYREGIEDQRDSVLTMLGAAPVKRRTHP